MRSDPFVARDVFGDFDAIRIKKHKPQKRRLAWLRGHVLSRYVAYWAARHTLDALPPIVWTERSREALLHCYNSATKARDRVLREIEDAVIPTPYLCPYCLMRQPKSLDHFLPQASYPEFAVLGWNLILACEPCNRRKSNTLHLTPRSVLNPYFDPIPDSALLHATLVIVNDRPKLRFRIDTTDGSVPAGLLELAKRHLTEFRLAKDFVREGTSYISTIITQIAVSFSAPITADQLEATLDDCMRGLSDFPINSWQGAVVAAMENCPDLLNIVNARIASSVRPPRLRPKLNLDAFLHAADAVAQANTA